MPAAVSVQVSPSTATCPSRGRTSPATTRSSVVLPPPDGPATARHPPVSSIASASSKSRRGTRASTESRDAHLRRADQLQDEQQGGAHGDEHGRERQRGLEVRAQQL